MKTQKEHLFTKVCESHCPKCGAGMKDIEWGSFEFDEVSYQTGTCSMCGCEFREYYNYSNTEWYEKHKKNLNTIKHTIEFTVHNQAVTIKLSGQDGKGNWSAGTITTTFHQESSDKDSIDDIHDKDQFNAMMDGIESLLLALAINNVDVTSSVFQSSLQAALDSCINNV